MPNPSTPCTGSSDITTLSYKIKYDISGALPTVILTNLSTVINPTQLKWWYVITTPSGTPIHEGSLAVPDVNNVAWTTLQIPSGSWPLLFGAAPCAQVEFSNNVPYICTLYVRDSANNQFSLVISQTITRPSGNTSKSCGNFGAAVATAEVNCNNKNVLCRDSTNFSYNNILAPSVQSNEWILVYPPTPTGGQPANGTAQNTPYVNFTIGYSGAGYVLFINDLCEYDMGNGATIKLQYKAIDPKTGAPGISFAVLCNIDMCKLQCQIDAFYKLSKKTCGVVQNSELLNKMTKMNFLFNQAMIGLMQPLCGIDVPAIIAEIQAIGDLDPNCSCGCADNNGVNFTYPMAPAGGSGGCCPISANIIDNATDDPPALCPASYFPVDVKDPTNTTIIGRAYNINDLIGLVNSYPAWQAYGVAFAEGNCKVGWFPATGAGTIPDIKVESVPVTPTVPIDVPVIDVDTDDPPAECPGAYFPVYVYEPNGTTLIGNANNITELINLINASVLWNAYGVAAFNGSFCTVTFTPNTGTTTIPDIIIKKDAGCVGSTINVNIPVTDPCGPPFGSLTPSSFPCQLFVDWNDGSGMHTLGTATSKVDLIAKLNADTDKPASVTVVDNTALASSIILNESNCTYTSTPYIYCDLGSGSYLLMGANSGNPIDIAPLPSSQLAIDGTAMTYLGAVPPGGSTGKRWHTILIGNVLLDTNPSTGKVRFFDVTNPKSPILITTVQLTTVDALNFTGNPKSSLTYDPGNVYDSYYELYFPTDLNSYMSTSEVYVSETTTGTIWKISMTGGVLAAFQDDMLLGKCPRVVAGGKLFFSQDGDVEDFTTGSGVNVGLIVILDLSDFTATGLSTKEIFVNQLRSVWAASYDGINTIYFIGTDTNIVTATGLSVGIYNVATDTVTSALIHIGPPAYGYANKRANSCISGGKLFCVALKDNVTNAAFFWNISALGTTNTYVVFDMFPYAVSPITITPVGNCYVAVTFIPGPINNPSYVVKYKVDPTSVSYLSFVQLTDAKMIYNVVAFPVVGYTPNSFV